MNATGHLVGHGPCPHCAKVLDRWGTVVGPVKRAPEVGDYTVCVSCLNLLRFAAFGRYERVTEAEIDAMEPDLLMALVTARAYAVGMKRIRQREKAGLN